MKKYSKFKNLNQIVKYLKRQRIIILLLIMLEKIQLLQKLQDINIFTLERLRLKKKKFNYNKQINSNKKKKKKNKIFLTNLKISQVIKSYNNRQVL